MNEPIIEIAIRAWRENQIYFDGHNYRWSRNTGKRRLIVPFNKELRLVFPGPSELHQAAHRT